MTNQDSKFEDYFLKGIGNIKDFKNLSIERLRVLIPEDRFGLFIATQPIPAEWPQEIMRNTIGELTKNEEKLKTEINEWYVSLKGEKWILFYSFGLTVYLEELKLIPAFIYERKANGGFLPVVSMLIDCDHLTIKQALKSWCDVVISTISNPGI